MMRTIALLVAAVLIAFSLSYFNITALDEQTTELYFTQITTAVRAGDFACFNYSYSGRERVEILLNNKTHQSACIQNAAGGIITVRAGNENIFFHVNQSNRTEIRAFSAPAEFENRSPSPLLLISLLLTFFLPGIFIASYFSVDGAIDFFAAAIAASIVLTVFFSFLFDLLNIDQKLIFIPLLLPALLIFRRCKMPRNISCREIKIIILFVLIVLFSLLFFRSRFTPWNVFYERQAISFYETGGMPAYDELSYLGRPFSFVTGYMYFRLGSSALADSDPVLVLPAVQFISLLFFLFAALSLSRALKLKAREDVIFLIFLCSSTFIFGWLALATLHLIGFALLLFALALAIRNNAASAVFAGFAGAFHASFIFAFPFLFLILTQHNLKRVVFYSALAAAVFAVMYFPVLANAGLPTEIQSENWGYFIRGDIVGLGTMTAGITSIAVLPALFFGFRREKKLALATAILILLFLTVSYRVNVFLTIIAAMLFIRVYGARFFKIILLLFALSMLLNLYVYHAETLGRDTISPLLFIKENSAPADRVLAEPFYGHATTFFTQRPVLADLYVECADDEKYMDAMHFIESGDRQILNKHNISFTLTLKNARIVRIAKFIYEDRELNYYDLDKIYSNEKFNIHWVHG